MLMGGAMISAVVLAAGLSSRMKANKLLLDLAGKEVILHVLEQVLASKVDEVILVLGRDYEVIKDLVKVYDIKVVYNKDYALGMSTSLKSGMNVLDSKSQGVMFIMGDQPLIKTSYINEILGHSLEKILVPTYKGKPANPVYFPKRWFAQLKRVTGDKGGRDIIRSQPSQVQYLEVVDEALILDVDNLESFNRVLEIINKKRC